MKIKKITLDEAQKANLDGIDDIEDHKQIFVCDTGNPYQSKAWFYLATDGFYCTCEISGMSIDSENKADAIAFIRNSLN